MIIQPDMHTEAQLLWDGLIALCNLGEEDALQENRVVASTRSRAHLLAMNYELSGDIIASAAEKLDRGVPSHRAECFLFIIQLTYMYSQLPFKVLLALSLECGSAP